MPAARGRPGREDRAPGWRWRPARRAADALTQRSGGQADSHSGGSRPLRASTAWAPLPETRSESENGVKLWDPKAWRPAHQVRLDLPRSARGPHGRRSNELLCKRADIPRDFVHLRARGGTALARPYSRAPTKDRPWAQPPPRVSRSQSVSRRGGIHRGDRVRLKAGVQQLKNGGKISTTAIMVQMAKGAPGTVKDVGPQYGGDVLVEWAGGKALWYSPAELQIV
jgi:hypothetical protein